MDSTVLLLERVVGTISLAGEDGAKQAAAVASVPSSESNVILYGLVCFVIDYDIFLDNKLWADVQAFMDSDDYYKSEALELRQQQEKLRNKDEVA